MYVFISTGIKSKEDNVNTPVIAMFIHAGDIDFASNLSVPIVYRLPYLNVSDYDFGKNIYI